MSSQERVKDILRLKLKIEEELIGKLYAVIQGRAGDRHHTQTKIRKARS